MESAESSCRVACLIWFAFCLQVGTCGAEGKQIFLGTEDGHVQGFQLQESQVAAAPTQLLSRRGQQQSLLPAGRLVCQGSVGKRAVEVRVHADRRLL